MEETIAKNENPTDRAERLIKAVRRRTRKNFTAEEKIRIVLEGMKRELTVTELCRREPQQSPIAGGASCGGDCREFGG